MKSLATLNEKSYLNRYGTSKISYINKNDPDLQGRDLLDGAGTQN